MRATAIFCLTHFILINRIEGLIDSNKSMKAAVRIIGGNPIDIKYRPFMLSLHNSDGYLCGASILSKRWGITALHCLILERTSNYFVRAGSNNPNEGGSLHKLTSIHVYNDSTFQYWHSRMLHHDLALFQVRPRFRFSSSVKPIRLPREFTKPPRELYVCGWGYTAFQSNIRVSDVLMCVFVRRTPHEICINETAEYKKLVKKENHLCYGARGKDSCYGDSGGPLANGNTIFGVVSFGQNCAVVSGVYENVAYYRRWIKRVAHL